MKYLKSYGIVIILLFTIPVFSQKYLTKNGSIRFFSDSPLEKIEARNKQVNCALDATTGDFVFKVLMKSFEFEKALMQEHFNENYVESDKFPNSTFIGKVTNIREIDLAKDGTYHAVVEGKLTIHGVTRNVREKGTFEVKQGKVNGKTKFNILLADYGIAIPGAVVNSISKTIEITVDISPEKSAK
jgi:polyisoprenoid-binding protein YceI